MENNWKCLGSVARLTERLQWPRKFASELSCACKVEYETGKGDDKLM